MALLVILPICLAATTTQVRGESGRSDLVDTAVAAGDFGTLVAAVKAAGLVETLLEPENKAKLVRILKYHVLSGRVYAEQAAAAKQVRTLLGRTVETSVTADGLRINDALVIRADQETARQETDRNGTPTRSSQTVPNS